MERQQEYVLRTIEERGVRLVRLWFTDVLGTHKSIAISPAELEKVFDEGLQFDGSAIDGFSRVQESDVLARPDPSSFELLPWAPDDEPSGLMFCDIENLDGTPFGGDPRQVLKRNLRLAREKGFTFFTAPEVEFFYFASGDPKHEPQPLDRASYFDLTTVDVSSDLRRRTLHMLERLGHPGRVQLPRGQPQPTRDRPPIQRGVVDGRQRDDVAVGRTQGGARKRRVRHVHAQALNGVQGSGMHTHMSLFEGESNAFHDPSDEYGLSKVGRCFIAGLLRHAREITAVTNQLVNSYKRLNEGYEAPQYVSWARNNRSALVRVPTPKRGKAESTRIEYRAIDPSCNPYLVFSLLLAAGMKGIQENYDLPREAHGNMFELSARINWRSASSRCHNRWQRRSTRWIDPRSFARRSVVISTNGSFATSDPNGVTINESSRSSNWTATCRCGER